MSNFRFTRYDSFPPVIKNLIIINVLVFIAQLMFNESLQLTSKLVMWPVMPAKLKELLVSSGVLDTTEGFKPYQVVTHMFAHSTDMIFHIVFNMFVLYMFGRILENVWGPKRFLFFYLASGLGAALIHLIVQYIRCEQLLQAFEANDLATVKRSIGAVAPALGASGAVMGVMVAFAFLFPNTELYMMFIPIPIKAKWVVLGLVAIDLFGGFANAQNDNIAHFAHLGGALTGFIIVWIWNKTNRKTLY